MLACRSLFSAIFLLSTAVLAAPVDLAPARGVDEIPAAVATDTRGAVYVAGTTRGRGAGEHIYVAKVDAAGTERQYTAYFGGSGLDQVRAIAVDSRGSVYIAGYTASPDFPVIGGLQSRSAGGLDVFLARLDPKGREWTYSTLIGGKGDDVAQALAVDGKGNVYLTGWTASADFPGAGGAAAKSGDVDAFVVKLRPGAEPSYSKYIGGGQRTVGNGIAVDSSGAVYVAGSAQGRGSREGLLGSTHPGQDAYLVKFDEDGEQVYAKVMGGQGEQAANAVALAADGKVWIGGWTNSSAFPVTKGATGRGGREAFAMQYDAEGTMALSTLLSGAQDEETHAIAVDEAGNVYLAGATRSTDFPVAGGLANRRGAGKQAFAVKLSADGERLLLSGAVSAVAEAGIVGLAIDGLGHAIVSAVESAASHVGQISTCGYLLSEGLKTIGPSGGSGTVRMETSAECEWTAGASQSWIEVKRTGADTLEYRVAANGGAPRGATIAAGGQTLVVMQSAKSGGLRDAGGFTGPVRTNTGFQSSFIGPCDDSCSTGAVALGFTLNFYGSSYSTVFVNNNGNVSFGAANTAFTPESIAAIRSPLIAPFWADVDTRGDGSGLVRYGQDIVDGRRAFGVNWVNVGYYSAKVNKLNSAQLVLIERGDMGVGFFDIEMNYSSIQWETGEADGGVNGLGGFSARAGFSNGTGNTGTFFEFPGSGVNGAFLDGGPNSLAANSTNSGRVAGRYVYNIRGTAVCGTGISPTSAIAAAGGQTLTVNVTASNSACTWNVTALPSWITVTSPQGGNGSGTRTVTLLVAPNTGVARSATITIAGQSYTVTQGGSCEFTLIPTTGQFPANGGTGSFSVFAASNCTWSATSGAGYITVTSGGSGTGNGTVGFSVAAQPAGASQSRSGTISVNGTLFTVTQNSLICSYSLTSSTTPAPIAASGGTGRTTVLTTPGCPWAATSNASFVRFTAGANGSVNGEVTFTVDPNTGAGRSATLTIAGRTFTVIQESGVGCPSTLSPPRATFVSSSVSNARLTVNNPCNWTATTTSNFIHITGGGSGSGPGSMTYSLDSNPGSSARTGTINVGNQTFTLTQSPAACNFSVSNSSLSVGAAGDSRTVQVTARGECGWSSSSNASFVNFPGASSGNGNGAVVVNIAGNTSTSPRTGSIVIAGRTITILQQGAQAFSCTTNNPASVPQIRAEGLAEQIADYVMSCGGSAGPAVADVVLQLGGRANITSRALDNAGGVEALLLLNEPTALQVGTNAFLGRLVGNNAVRFPSVPISTAQTIRITNLRVDANAVGAGQAVTATAEVRSAVPVGIGGGVKTLANVVSSMNLTVSPPSSASNGVNFNIQFQERLINAFKTRIGANQNPSQPGASYGTESGFVNTAVLGQNVGVATTATRMLIRLGNIPSGARVIAPATPLQSSAAQLVTQDSSGAGVGLLSSSTEMAVVDGASSVTYEIVSTNPASLDTLAFNILLQNISVSQANQISASAILGPSSGVNASGVAGLAPRFIDPSAPARSSPLLRVRGGVQSAAADTAVRSAAMRAADANGLPFGLVVTTTNDSNVETPVTVVYGSLSEGANWDGGCTAADGGGSCAGTSSGPGGGGVCTDCRNVVIEYPSLSPGQSATATISGILNFNAPGGSEIEFRTSANSDLTTTYDTVLGCVQGSSAIPLPPGAGGTFSFQVFACGPWTLTSNVPWITFTPASGSGNTLVSYSATRNAGNQTRTGTIFFPGGSAILTQPPDDGTPPGNGLRFVPVAPCRVMDTRNAAGPFGGPIVTGDTSRTVPMSGACGLPSGARAYSVNVTVVPAQALGYLSLYPAGQSRPLVSTLNAFEGQIVANAALVPAGANGAITVYVSNTTHVILDVNGYFTDTTGPETLVFYPLAPCRVVDTRVGQGKTGAFGPPQFNAGTTRTFPIPTSTCAIPSTARAYSVNFTVEPPGPLGYISAWPTGQPQPLVSTLNSVQGRVLANAAIVPAGTNGSIDVFAYNATHIIMDINGYFGPPGGAGGLRFFTLNPCRIADTRDASFGVTFGPPRMETQQTRTFPLTSSGCSVPLAQAYSLNATVVPPGFLGFLTLWPGGPLPLVSTLNAMQGQVAANAAIVPSSGGAVNVFTSNPSQVILDINGYFAP